MLDIWVKGRAEGWGPSTGRVERIANLLDAVEKCVGVLRAAAGKTGLTLAPALTARPAEH